LVHASIRGFLDAYLRLNAEEIMEYNREVQTIEPKEQEAVMQIVNEWEEIGEARGLDEGKRLGRLETLVDLLESRLGSLPPDVRQRVSALSLLQLKSLTLAATGLGEVDALCQWLDSVRVRPGGS